MAGNSCTYEQRINAKALAIALAVYQPEGMDGGSSDHADRLYYAVDRADFGSDERKADLYARLADKLTAHTRLDQAEAIIAECMHATNRSYFNG